MKDEWVTTALSNDAIVVELLFRLKQSACEPPAKPRLPPPLCLPSGWGHRQPRSKPPVSAKKDSAMTTSTTRCSPTTPLSWSGGATSPSDGAYEDCSNSSRPSFDPSRSKVCILLSLLSLPFSVSFSLRLNLLAISDLRPSGPLGRTVTSPSE